jgi:asparagine synthase (glutamine-hydrolysing)
MCGIAGHISMAGRVDTVLVKKMTDAIRHRGPDGEGHWIDAREKVCLGHRRLSIIDISESGSQPMHYLSRYSIVFNGEFYNYLEIRKALVKKGYSFNSTSDTEVLLALYHERKEKCLQELDGMFAFVVFDAVENTIFMARDRFGEKPLFYSFDEDGNLLFASEMKAIWAAGVAKEINHRMLFNFFSKSLLENPNDKKETFYKNIYRFPAAHYASFSTKDVRVQPVRFWNIDVQNQNFDITEKEAARRLEQLLCTSMTRRLRSDVPLGSSLSGGLDSSLIVCLLDAMDQQNAITRKTFSAQFPGFVKDESYYQQLVVQQCGVDPHFVYPTSESMLANLEKVMYYQEEPFGSASICIQYEVFGLAKENNVTVLLDGQGADEILAGYHSYYPSYFNGLKQRNTKEYRAQMKRYRKLHADNNINVQHQTNWKDYLRQVIPDKVQQMFLQKKRDVYSGAAFLSEDFVASHKGEFDSPSTHSSLNCALYHETMNYGLEFLLRYADRNSMAHSREVRLPFLYHELVEFLFTLPDDFKIREGWTKWIMRKTFEGKIPKQIAWRKDKVGYEPPQENWMEQHAIKNEIRESIQTLVNERILSPKALTTEGAKNLQWKSFVVSGTLLAPARHTYSS